jgi:hypothetical protein
MDMEKRDRDEFTQKVRDALARRASYLCSNPDCRSLTIAASADDPEKWLYIGKAAHMAAAAKGGPRYDHSMTSEQRASIENGIFLCSSCAAMIDSNNGRDHPVPLLRRWKEEHEAWVRANLNKSPWALIPTIGGEHRVRGVGEVTGLDVRTTAIISPGTVVDVEGMGKVTGVRISPPPRREGH